MPKTYTQIVADASAKVQDTANAVFATTEFDSIMPAALVAISQYVPWNPPKLTKTTVADSYDLTLSAGDKWRLLEGTGYKKTGIVKAEYEVDKDPRQFRGLTKFGNILSLELDSRPSSAASVYLYMNKIHILQSAIGTSDTAAAIKTTAAVGATSLALNALGTGTINEMTTLAIAGDSTVYYVTSAATIAANEATVTIWPPLAAQATATTVVTLSLTDSTLDMSLEDYLARWLAAQAAINKATLSYAQVNTAITTIANAATAIAAIAALINLATTAGTGDIALGRASAALGATAIVKMEARVALAIIDINSARTETGKVSTLLDSAKTEIDKILALLDNATGAQIDIALGKTELNKVVGLISTQAGALLDAVTALIALATTAGTGDIALARAAIALGVTAISSANTEVAKITTEVGLGKTALASGASLINTITVGGGAPEYMGQANADVNVAQGYLSSGQGYILKANGDFNNAATDLAAATKDLDAAIAKIREAQGFFEEAKMDIEANRGYVETATAKLRVAQGYFQEAQGYVMAANARIANSASFLQVGTGEIRAASIRAEEASADHANAASYYAAASEDFRAAAVKAQEAVTNLNLVAARLQVSAGGLRYEQWGRQELAAVKAELLVYGGLPHSTMYPRS